MFCDLGVTFESKHTIPLSGCTRGDAEVFLEALYGRQISLGTLHGISPLLALASRFEAAAVLSTCSQLLCKFVHDAPLMSRPVASLSDTLCDVLILADTYNLSLTYDACAARMSALIPIARVKFCADARLATLSTPMLTKLLAGPILTGAELLPSYLNAVTADDVLAGLIACLAVVETRAPQLIDAYVRHFARVMDPRFGKAGSKLKAVDWHKQLEVLRTPTLTKIIQGMAI